MSKKNVNCYMEYHYGLEHMIFNTKFSLGKMELYDQNMKSSELIDSFFFFLVLKIIDDSTLNLLELLKI